MNTYSSSGKETTRKEKVIIAELRARYPFKLLLTISGIKRSTYYFYINKKDIDIKNQDIIEKIKEIYWLNNSRYGYRRITLELKNQGFTINHKEGFKTYE